MPRYEFVDGKSSKFWEIRLEGESFTTTYGRIGASGQSTTKRFGSPEKASRQYETLIAEKVGKGYKLVAVRARSRRRVHGGVVRGRRPSDRSGRAAKHRKQKKARLKIPWGYDHPRYKAMLRQVEAKAAAAKARLERATKRPKRKKARGKIPWGYDHPKYKALVQSLDNSAAEARAEHERIAKLPKRIAKQLDWDGLEAAARPGPARGRAADARVTAVSGLAKMPPSYREYLRRFSGTGYWDLVYQKKDWPNQFNLLGNRRMAGERARLLRTYRTEAPELAARWRSLVPFASDASSTYFCWDSSAVDARGEPPVYAAEFKMSDPDGYQIRRLGNDLLFVLQHYRRPDGSV